MKQNLAANEDAPPAVHESAESPRAVDPKPVDPKSAETKSAETKSGRRAPREPAGGVTRVVRITSPESLVRFVPRLLGFQPSNSMVLMGTEPPRARVRLTLRYDLPDPADPDLPREIARHAVAVLGAQCIRTAVGVGYGPSALVTPVADAIREVAGRDGMRVSELLRVEGQRYWSYLCRDKACCPPEGTPFTAEDPRTISAEAGEMRVLASRAELAATVAPFDGDTAEIMHAATRRAEEHSTRLTESAERPKRSERAGQAERTPRSARSARGGRSGSSRRALISAGLGAVREAIDRYRRGGRIEAGDSAAWLTLVLRNLRVRDDAWARMDPKHREAHLRLWTDLTRLARPGYVPAPAALLAFVAWQSGNGALANVALDRALREDPYYSMAQLLRQAIDSGAPPSMARLPLTPDQVAASYDELEESEDEAEDEE